MIYVKDAEVYATVWKVTPAENGKYIDIQMTTSEKKDDGYENSGWWARVIGHGLNSLKELKERDRIKISSFKLTNVYNKEKEQSYLRMIIFEAKVVENKTNENEKSADVKKPAKTKTPATKTPNKTEKQTDSNGEDLPW